MYLYEGEQFACQSTIETFVWTTDTVWSMHIIIIVINVIIVIIVITVIIIITTFTITTTTTITKKIYIVLILSCDVDFENLKKTLFQCHHGMLIPKIKIDIDIDKSDIVWPIIDNTGSRLKAIIWCSVLDWTCCWKISVLMTMMMIVFLFPYICDDNHHL